MSLECSYYNYIIEGFSTYTYFAFYPFFTTILNYLSKFERSSINKSPLAQTAVARAAAAVETVLVIAGGHGGVLAELARLVLQQRLLTRCPAAHAVTVTRKARDQHHHQTEHHKGRHRKDAEQEGWSRRRRPGVRQHVHEPARFGAGRPP
jgi:hypothetical protein